MMTILSQLFYVKAHKPCLWLNVLVATVDLNTESTIIVSTASITSTAIAIFILVVFNIKVLIRYA